MVKMIALNKKASHDFFLEDTFECGICLVGNEIKSLRQGKVNLKDSYAAIDKGEVFLKNCHISPYEKGTYFTPLDAKRDRKLLLHKYQISKLIGKVKEKGYSLVPTKIYLKDSLVKIEIALAKGKQLYDKRQALNDKQQKRQIERAIKEYNR